MKRYTEYTNTELAALDEAGIQRLIDIELAVAGVAPVPQPQAFTLAEAKLNKTERCYKVGSLHFKKLADAEKVAQMELLNTGYDYSGAGYSYNWLVPMNATVEAEFYYKEAEVRSAGQKLKEFNKRKEEYQEDKSAWDKYQKQIGDIKEGVWLAVRAAQREMCRIDDAFQTLNKYKDLADGAVEVAENFFRNTYQAQPDIIKAVLGEDETETAFLMGKTEEQVAA
jgi:hypothetical protein